MAKGGEWERELCKTLSNWWIPGRTDIFWRSSNSGGRATARGKRGQKTFGSQSDIAAVDPIGRPLLELMTIEAKRGYSKSTLMDLLERPLKKTEGPLIWEKWIAKAIVDAEAAGSLYWAIVARRDQREAVMVMPCKLWDRIVMAMNGVPNGDWFAAGIKINGEDKQTRITAIKFKTFLEKISRKDIEAVLEQHKKAG